MKTEVDMGYFSNGTDGDIYQSNFCNRCIHDKEGFGCQIMNAHFFFNYDQHKNEQLKEVLSMLIPREEDEGEFNGQCLLYVPKERNQLEAELEKVRGELEEAKTKFEKMKAYAIKLEKKHSGFGFGS